MDEKTFAGWTSRGYLPHCDDPVHRQFITYRLNDSLPRDVIARLRATHTESEFRALYNERLDAGYGACHLSDPRCGKIVVDNWKHHDGLLYRLRDFVVMPNHGHVDIEPLVPLRIITQAWKSYTSKRIASVLELPETRLWQPGYHDRYHRDRRHSHNIQRYIYLNPVVAGLVDDPFEWEFSSIHEQDEAMKDEIWRWFKDWRRRFYVSV